MEKKRNILALIAVAVILTVGFTVRLSFSVDMQNRILDMVKLTEEAFRFEWNHSELIHWEKKAEATEPPVEETTEATTEPTTEPTAPEETTVPTEEPALPPVENEIKLEQEEEAESSGGMELPWDMLGNG